MLIWRKAYLFKQENSKMNKGNKKQVKTIKKAFVNTRKEARQYHKEIEDQFAIKSVFSLNYHPHSHSHTGLTQRYHFHVSESNFTQITQIQVATYLPNYPNDPILPVFASFY